MNFQLWGVFVPDEKTPEKPLTRCMIYIYICVYIYIYLNLYTHRHTMYSDLYIYILCLCKYGHMSFDAPPGPRMQTLVTCPGWHEPYIGDRSNPNLNLHHLPRLHSTWGGSEIWAPKNPSKTDRLGLKFDTQTEGLGIESPLHESPDLLGVETRIPDLVFFRRISWFKAVTSLKAMALVESPSMARESQLCW